MEAAFHFWLFLPLCVCAASCAAGWPHPCSAPCCHRGSELRMSQPQPQTRSHLAATARFVPVALGEPTLLRRGQAETPNAQLQVPCVPTAQAVTRTWPNAPCPPPAPCRWAPCGTLNPQPHLSSSTCPATPGSLASSNHPDEHPRAPRRGSVGSLPLLSAVGTIFTPHGCSQALLATALLWQPS